MNTKDKSKKREFRSAYHWEKDVWLLMATDLSTEIAWPRLVPKAFALRALA